MNQQEQIAAVGQVLTLTTRIAGTEEKLVGLERETFRSKPLPPKQTTITASYPEIKPDDPLRNIKPGAGKWMKTGSADRQRQTSSIRRR